MNRTHVYSFVGASAAVKLRLANAAKGWAASAQLESVAQELLAAACGNASDEELKKLVAKRVVDVVEAVEALRSSGAAAGFDATLNSLLDYFYNAAESVLGGGGSTDLVTSGFPYPSEEP